MATLAELQAWADRLSEARYNGIRSVRDSNGEELVYRSDGELARALAAVRAEIAGASASRASVVYIQSSKGV